MADTLLDLQRAAGNRAVAQLLEARLPVQRHPPTLPEVTATPTQTQDGNLGDLPTAADKSTLRKEQSALNTERKQLTKKGRKRSKEDNARLKEIDERLKLIEHRLQLRVQGDATKDEEKTLQINNITTGAAAWFANVHTVKFLDQYATVHDLLATRLASVEAALQNVPKPAEGWVKQDHSSLRGPGQSLHSFGLAIDLNPGLNPQLVDPNDPNGALYEPNEQSESVASVLNHAFLLVLGKSSDQEAFFTRTTGADKKARVEKSYDKIAEASQALRRYMTLDAPDKSDELAQLVRDLGERDPERRSAQQWVTIIAADRESLNEKAKNKHWSKPESGFLDLDKRLVKAMTDPAVGGLTWLGDYTIASGRDIMHFDMRGVGPIKAVWKGGRSVNLGED